MKLISLFFIVFLLSCSIVNDRVKKAWGIKDPQIETKEGLQRYLDSSNINNIKNSVVLKNFDSYKSLIKTYSIGQMFVFNQDGNYLSPPNNTCTAIADTILKNINQVNLFNIDTSKSIFKAIPQFSDYQGNSIKIKPNVKHYVLITWAKFFGSKMNTARPFKWLDEYNKYVYKDDTELLLVNFDLLKDWNIPEKELK